MLNSVILFLLLLGTWLVLSGFFTPFFLFLGVVSSVLAVIIFIRTSPETRNPENILGFMFRLPSYILWLLKEIIRSSMSTTVKMWQLEPEISPDISWVSTTMRDDLSLTVLGNSITLTPGTVTCGVRNDGMVQVHALNKESIEGLRKGYMSKEVMHLVRDNYEHDKKDQKGKKK